jgi:hypothetical protein
MDSAPPAELSCCICGGNPIPAPAGVTKRTRFWCRRCCARLTRDKNIAESREFAEELRNQKEAARRRLLARRGAKWLTATAIVNRIVSTTA